MLIAPGVIYLNQPAGSRNVFLKVTDLEGNPTNGVSPVYRSSHPSICSVDYKFGNLYPKMRGIVKITGYGYRGRYVHSSSKIIIIGEDESDDMGDFRVKLTFEEPITPAILQVPKKI